MPAHVQPSWWFLLASVSSAIVGQCWLLLKARKSAGGGLRTALHALVEEPGAAGAVLVVDLAGGVLLGGTAMFLAVTRPSDLVEFMNQHLILGWLLFGAIGPYVADRMFAGSMIEGRFRGWITNGEDSLGSQTDEAVSFRGWHLRTEAVQQIRRKCWEIAQRTMITEASRLRSDATRGLDSLRRVDDDSRADIRSRRLRELPGACLSYKKSGLVTMPDDVEVQLSLYASATTASRETLLDILDALVEVLLREQIWHPLYAVIDDRST